MTNLLRNRSLMLMGLAEIINSIGGWITSMALYSILIFQEHGGIGKSAGIFLASLGPALLLSPLAGWLCDRYDRRTLMIGSRLLQGAAVAGLIVVQSGPAMYALLVLSAIFGLVMAPARTTAMPDVVAPEALSQANAFMQQVTGTVKILAPALAGGLLTVMTPQMAIALDVASFAIAAAILMLLPSLPPRGRLAKGQKEEQSSIWGAMRTLARIAPGLMLMLPLNVMTALVIMAFDVSLAVYVRDLLQTGIAFKGVIGLTVGSGMIAGSSLFLFLKGERNLWRDLMVGYALLTTLPGALALGEATGPAAGRILLAGACLLGGIGIGVINVQAGTLFLRLCPPAILGRTNGVFESIAVVGRLIGLLATPILVPDVVSFGGYFGAATGLLVVMMAVTAIALGRMGRAPGAALQTHEVAVDVA